MQHISDHGLQFLIGWEGSRNDAYDDGGPGIGNCTIGVGHLIHLGPCTQAELATSLTDEEVMDLLRVDVRRFEETVSSHATIELNQNQFDALVDFCFNTGGGYPRVWATVNSGGDVAGVLATTAITPAWATAALVRRRKAEGALYNTPYQEPQLPPLEEEDEDMPAVVWNTDLKTVQLTGHKAIITIGDPVEVGELEKKYGKQIALSDATIKQMVSE